MNESHRTRVIVAGSINMDIVATVERHPVPGETLVGTNLSYFPGGKGANQAVAAARAGSTVVILGAIGDDAFGPDLLQFLESNGVEASNVARRAGTPTGTALILVDAAGENEIVVVPGANGTVDRDLVAKSELKKGDVLVAQFETPVESTGALFALGRSVGATCVLNPAPAGPIPDDLLSLVDVLVVNETELGVAAAEDLTPTPALADVRRVHAFLQARGFRGALVATLGARGSITLVGDRAIEVTGRQVSAIDTTGAGDCFVGFFASELARGSDIDRALQIANVAGSLCVQRPGAGPSMPRRDEVQAEAGLN
jgi:ribokinase